MQIVSQIAGYLKYRFTSHNRLLLLLMLLVIGLRIAAMLSLKQTIYFENLLIDEKLYHNWALKILNGTGGSAVYEMSPLFAYVMAFVYLLISPNVLYIRFLNIVLGCGTCLTIYGITKALSDKQTALVALLISGGFSPFILYSIVPLKTSLSVLLFSLFVRQLIRVIKKQEVIQIAFLGLLSGIMINVRENYLIVLSVTPILIFWICWKKKHTETGIDLPNCLYPRSSGGYFTVSCPKLFRFE